MKILFPFNPVDSTKIFQRTYNNYINGQLFVRINIKNLIFIGLLFTQLNLRSFFSARTYILFTQSAQRFSFSLRALRDSLRALREQILFHAKSAKCFFSLRALRISLRSLREPVFYTISTFKGNLSCLAICSKCSFFSAVEE